jgi:hypothetical protein
LESISKRMLECDGHGEISGWFRLHSKNLAANAGLCAGVGEGSNSKPHLYRGTLWDQRRTRKQNAPHTDVLRTRVQFLVGNLERDMQVQRVASVASLWPLRGIHLWTCALGKRTPEPVQQTGNDSVSSPEEKADLGTVTCYGNPRLARSVGPADLCESLPKPTATTEGRPIRPA